jgi:hypothetical protein
LIDYSSIKFLQDSAILQITAEFFLINLQKPVKLLNFTDFMKKICGNLQKLQICRTSQKCAKKVQKKCRKLRILQFSTDLHPKNSPIKGIYKSTYNSGEVNVEWKIKSEKNAKENYCEAGFIYIHFW